MLSSFITDTCSPGSFYCTKYSLNKGQIHKVTVLYRVMTQKLMMTKGWFTIHANTSLCGGLSRKNGLEFYSCDSVAIMSRQRLHVL